MPRLIVIAAFIIGAALWGDWKSWEKYYPTILYFIVCSLLYASMHCLYPLWRFVALAPIHNILCNDTLICVALTFTVFPSTAILYLSHYPQGKKQVPYVFAWVLLYTSIETCMLYFGGITHHNGWSLTWSAFFNVILFSFLRLHYVNPKITWGASVLFILFIWGVFGFPVKA